MRNFWNRTTTLLAAGLLALGIGAIAYSQGFQIPNNSAIIGHLGVTGNVPVGTGCTIVAGSTDTAGSCTASAASGSVAFATAYAIAPFCLVTDGSATSTVSMPVYTTTTAQITLSTIISTHVLYWFCAAKTS